LVRFNLAVARSCFVKCRGCYNHFSGEKDLVSVESIRAFLEFCQAHTVVSGVTICGGDPLSRGDIIDLVSMIRNLGIRVKLDTVGTSFLGRSERRFFGSGWVEHTDPSDIVPLLGEIAIPLDGWSQESVVLFREGRPHLFEEALKILDLVTRFGTPVGVNTVVHRGNMGGLRKIEKVISRFQVAEWQLFEYRPSGPLSFRNRDQFMLLPDQFDEIKAEFARDSGGALSPSIITAKKAREVLPSRLVVDSNGLAWSHLEWVEPPAPDPGPRRFVVGNIQNPEDYDRILAAAEMCMNGRVQSEGLQVAMGSHLGWGRGPGILRQENL
jgi:MoaA/NifB/PqqE/SkfB family radical SAM enzyme